MPTEYPAFTYQDPKPANLNNSVRFYSRSSPRRMRKTLQDEEPSTRGAGIYVRFQFVWLLGKRVWGIRLPLGLISCAK